MRTVLRGLVLLFPIASLVVGLGAPSPVRADPAVVWVRMPAERQVEMTAALRLELAGRASLIEGPAVDPERATVAEMRDEARAAAATHAVWIVFPGGLLAPAEVRVLAVEHTTAAHAMAPQAWDVVDLRVVAVLAASLIEAASSEAGIATPSVEAAEPQAAPLVVVEQPANEPAIAAPSDAAPGAAEPTADPEHLTLTEPGARPARTFSFWLGPSVAHIARPGRGIELTSSGQMAFYGRLTEWASIGLRFRIGAAGYSSLAGALFSGSIAVPSILVSFREPLGTAAAIELGVHAEGGLFVDYQEIALTPRDGTRLSFGLGVGAFVGRRARSIERHPARLHARDLRLRGLGHVDVGQPHARVRASVGLMWPFAKRAPEASSQRDLDEQVLRDLLLDARRWISRYAGPRADLDDLVQESMIELVVALDRFRGDSSVRTYAHRIVLRTTAREIAKRRTLHRRLELVPDVEREGRGDPERDLSDRQTMLRFYEALQELSEKRRNAFVLCAIEKLSHDEAAAIESVSVETLRARLKHARSDLDAALANDPLLGPYVGGRS